PVGTGRRQQPPDGRGDAEGRRNTDPQLPDLAMRYQSTLGDLSFQFAGLAREISNDDLPGLVDEDDSVFGWGLNTGATLALDTGTTLKLSAAYGEGMGSYIYSPTFSSVYVDDNAELDTASTLGVIASVGQQLTDTLSANLIYGYGHSEADGDHWLASTTVGATTFESSTGQSVAANLLYSTVDALVVGVEYTYVDAELEQEDG